MDMGRSKAEEVLLWERRGNGAKEHTPTLELWGCQMLPPTDSRVRRWLQAGVSSQGWGA